MPKRRVAQLVFLLATILATVVFGMYGQALMNILAELAFWVVLLLFILVVALAAAIIGKDVDISNPRSPQILKEFEKLGITLPEKLVKSYGTIVPDNEETQKDEEVAEEQNDEDDGHVPTPYENKP